MCWGREFMLGGIKCIYAGVGFEDKSNCIYEKKGRGIGGNIKCKHLC